MAQEIPVMHVGCLGGGQLGRMMAQAASRLGCQMTTLDPAGLESPMGRVCGRAVVGEFKDPAKVRELAAQVDVLTVEIEHVDTTALADLEKEGASVHPSAATIALIQDKYAQKLHLSRIPGVPLGEFCEIPDATALLAAGERWGYPLMLKTKRDAYDGRGNLPIQSKDEASKGYASLSRNGVAGVYAEKWCPFTKELAVMVARSKNGEVQSYPTVETKQKDSICHTVVVPADAPSTSLASAAAIASAAVASFSGGGIFGVELFLLPDGSVLLNEIAPRPHNSGHYTMDACHTDQFEQHLRCILGLPLGSTGMKAPYAAMLNILGDGALPTTLAPVQRALTTVGAAVHWYGKSPPKAQRKMGHINVTGPTPAVVISALATLQGGDADTISGAKRLRSEVGLEASGGGRGGAVVGVIMGSDSDLPCMRAAAEILERFGVPFEVTIVSAHRTPQRLYEYSRDAEERGLRVIIAGAGGAAHLPGMVAALTPLPVIGVPVKSSMLSGNDSLLSIVQMPKGIPVATVAIHNAANAGLLAVRMLGMADPALRTAMAIFMKDQETEVLGKAAKLERDGHKGYA